MPASGLTPWQQAASQPAFSVCYQTPAPLSSLPEQQASSGPATTPRARARGARRVATPAAPSGPATTPLARDRRARRTATPAAPPRPATTALARARRARRAPARRYSKDPPPRSLQGVPCPECCSSCDMFKGKRGKSAGRWILSCSEWCGYFRYTQYLPLDWQAILIAERDCQQHA